MTTALDNNATRNALTKAIKEHIDPTNPQKVNIKKYIIKQYKPEDPTGLDKLAKFAWELHHGNRTMRNRDHVLELFGLLTLKATGLEERKTNKAKVSPLKEVVFKVLKQVAGQDILMIVALNELMDQLTVTRINSWETFFKQLAIKRTELESLADTVYELSGVSPGAVEDLDAVIVPLYNDAQSEDITSIDWSNRSWWEWANTKLLENVGKAA